MTKLRLQEIAQSQGLTISQIQRRTGLTMTMVRRYWYNQTRTVSLDAIDTLSALLKVHPGDLLVKEED